MTASIFCSTKQLIAAAAPATKPIPNVAAISTTGGTMPGVARNMPMTAVNKISDTTRGLVSWKNCCARLTGDSIAKDVDIFKSG